MDAAEVKAVLQQAIFFNIRWKKFKDKPHLSELAELMRMSKNRCQLMLLKFALPNLVYAYEDKESTNGEWLIGGSELPDSWACHIPVNTLKDGLSTELLKFWNII